MTERLRGPVRCGPASSPAGSRAPAGASRGRPVIAQARGVECVAQIARVIDVQGQLRCTCASKLTPQLGQELTCSAAVNLLAQRGHRGRAIGLSRSVPTTAARNQK